MFMSPRNEYIILTYLLKLKLYCSPLIFHSLIAQYPVNDVFYNIIYICIYTYVYIFNATDKKYDKMESCKGVKTVKSML